MYNLSTVKVEREHTFLLFIFGLLLVNNERQINTGESNHDSVKFDTIVERNVAVLGRHKPVEVLLIKILAIAVFFQNSIET